MELKTCVLDVIRLKEKEVKKPDIASSSLRVPVTAGWSYFFLVPSSMSLIFTVPCYLSIHPLYTIHTYIHTNIHTYIHTYIHIYIQNSMVIFCLMLKPSK